MQNPFLNLSDEQLLEQCEIESFSSSGSGGQHVNTTDSAMRIRHLPTGLTVVAREERSQYLNKLHCVAKLREKLEKLYKKQKPRIPTKKPRSAKEKVLKTKAKVSQKKKLRARPFSE